MEDRNSLIESIRNKQQQNIKRQDIEQYSVAKKEAKEATNASLKSAPSSWTDSKDDPNNLYDRAFHNFRENKIEFIYRVQENITQTLLNALLTNKINVSVFKDKDKEKLDKELSKKLQSILGKEKILEQIIYGFKKAFLKGDSIIKFEGDLEKPKIYVAELSTSMSTDASTGDILFSYAVFNLSTGGAFRVIQAESYSSIGNFYSVVKTGSFADPNDTASGNPIGEFQLSQKDKDKLNFKETKVLDSDKKPPYVYIYFYREPNLTQPMSFFYPLKPLEADLAIAYEKLVKTKLKSGIKFFPNDDLFVSNYSTDREFELAYEENDTLRWHGNLDNQSQRAFEVTETTGNFLQLVDAAFTLALNRYKEFAFKVQPNFAGGNQKSIDEIEVTKEDETVNKTALTRISEHYLEQLFSIMLEESNKDYGEVDVEIIPHDIFKKDVQTADIYSKGLLPKKEALKDIKSLNDVEATKMAKESDAEHNQEGEIATGSKPKVTSNVNKIKSKATALDREKHLANINRGEDSSQKL